MINIALAPILSKFEENLKNQTDETKKELYKKLDIDLIDRFHMLDINAQSFASQLISLDLSQFLYNKLKAYENTTLAERLVITQVMAELLKIRRAQK